MLSDEMVLWLAVGVVLGHTAALLYALGNHTPDEHEETTDD